MMGRARTKNHELPYLCYRKIRSDNGAVYFVYKRPDSKKTKTLGYDEEKACDLAERLNEFFGVSGDSNLRGFANLIRKKAVERIKSGSHIDKDIKEFLPDLFPRSKTARAKEKRVIQSWADSHNHTRELKEPLILKAPLETLKNSSWLKNLLQNTRKNSIKRGIVFDLTIDDLAIVLKRSSGKCEVSGLKLFHDKTEHNRRPYAPSIDRIDSSKGYSFENIRIVCVAVNLAMNEWGETVLMQVAAGIYKEQISEN